MPKPKQQQPKPKVGRPRELPAGTKVRNMRLTDAEYARVRQVVREMREKPTSHSVSERE